jgi:hypothetical protein
MKLVEMLRKGDIERNLSHVETACHAESWHLLPDVVCTYITETEREL